ncbi:MAG TPA: 50S ribosomal protein L2, partial [Candidatus Bathyarchaeota archaeon]|nr:50S ribosomal protein L2 [Candidatus Bathyarchaeota archaeon]
MGKRIRVQRRGRGSPTWRASTHKRVAPSKYPNPPKEILSSVMTARVKQIVHDPGRGAPLACIELENGEKFYSVV